MASLVHHVVVSARVAVVLPVLAAVLEVELSPPVVRVEVRACKQYRGALYGALWVP